MIKQISRVLARLEVEQHPMMKFIALSMEGAIQRKFLKIGRNPHIYATGTGFYSTENCDRRHSC
jgi:hypothetical protein